MILIPIALKDSSSLMIHLLILLVLYSSNRHLVPVLNERNESNESKFDLFITLITLLIKLPRGFSHFPHRFLEEIWEIYNEWILTW